MEDNKLKFEYIAIDELVPYARNQKIHSQSQIDLIAKSIKEFGFLNPCIIDKDNNVIAGHGRILGAKQLGMDKLPCVRAEDLTDDQGRCFRITDNKMAELSEWDPEMLKIEFESLNEIKWDLSLTGFSPDEIEESLNFVFNDPDKEGTDTEPGDVNLNEPAYTQLGDIYQLGRHRLLCGDSTDAGAVFLLLEKQKIDMVFTDPPYGVSIQDKNKLLNKCNYDIQGRRNEHKIISDDISGDELREILTNVFKIVKENSQDHCTYYVTAPQGGDLGLMMMMMMKDAGLPIRHVLIWVKSSPTFSMGRLDYDYQHEPILYTWNKKHEFQGKGKFTKTIWNIDKPRESKLHPTMKPIELVENALLNSSLPQQIITDPFLGSGSTLIAAENLGRICYGMELDPHYCDVIVKRFQKHTKSSDIKLIRGNETISFDMLKKTLDFELQP